MAYEIINLIKKAGIFMILAETLIHCCPESAYEKYIRLIVEVMLISLLVFPVLSLIGGLNTEELKSKITQMELMFEDISDEAEEFKMPEEETIKNSIDSVIEEVPESDEQ